MVHARNSHERYDHSQKRQSMPIQNTRPSTQPHDLDCCPSKQQRPWRNWLHWKTINIISYDFTMLKISLFYLLDIKRKNKKGLLFQKPFYFFNNTFATLNYLASVQLILILGPIVVATQIDFKYVPFAADGLALMIAFITVDKLLYNLSAPKLTLPIRT